MRRSSFVCPACHELATIVDVRPNGTGGEFTVRRRYACNEAECGHRWTTGERTEDLSRGQRSMLETLSPLEQLRISKLCANKLQQLAYKLRNGKL